MKWKELYQTILTNLMVYVKFPLGNDFSNFKNNLKKYCSEKWIFNIDADEVPSEFLLNNLHSILTDNSEVDIIIVPRWNMVEGITDDHIKKWGWNFDEYERVNWPDYQTRIYKNKEQVIPFYLIKDLHIDFLAQPSKNYFINYKFSICYYINLQSNK